MRAGAARRDHPLRSGLAATEDSRSRGSENTVVSEGAHDVVIPHLTVAEGGVELQDEVEAALTEHLPIAARADDVAFLFEGDDGLWREAHRFPLSD